MVVPKIIVQNCTRLCSSTLFNPPFFSLSVTQSHQTDFLFSCSVKRRRCWKKILTVLMVSPHLLSHSEHICKEIIDNWWWTRLVGLQWSLHKAWFYGAAKRWWWENHYLHLWEDHLSSAEFWFFYMQMVKKKLMKRLPGKKSCFAGKWIFL